MNKNRTGAVFLGLLMCGCGLASQGSAQGPEPKFNSNADDLAKIRGVLEEFRQDIIRKDRNALTKLVLNPNVLFHHINGQDEVDSARKKERSVRWDWPEPARWICEIPRYVEGQNRREISQHRDSSGRSSGAGDIQLRFRRKRQSYQFGHRGLAGVQNRWAVEDLVC